MKNSYWYRYFLICNQLANKVMGHQPQNFALLRIEEEGGRFMNSQMTCHFDNINEFFSDLMCNDSSQVFDELDIDELAELSAKQLEEDFEKYCGGSLKMFEFTNK
jgi:hypothetical protein